MSNDPRHRLGRRGEHLAAEHLQRRGYRIVARNVHSRFGELDLIAADPDTLVFCEVKTRRAGGGHPFEALDAAQRRRIRAMARAWLAESGRPRRTGVRFDAIGVTIDAHGRLVALEHLEGCF